MRKTQIFMLFPQMRKTRFLCSPACCKEFSPQILVMKGCSLGAPRSMILLEITMSHPPRTVASTCCLFAGNPSHIPRVPITSASLRTSLQGLALRTVIRAHMAAVQMGALQPQALWAEVAPSAPATETGMDAVLMEYRLPRVLTTWDAHNITVTFK